jgi:hypothetical protein
MENDNTKNQSVECREAFENLKQHQQQLDEDGIMVGVSRQALDLVLNWIENTRNPAPSRMTENEANKNVGDLVEMVAKAINDSLPSDMTKWNVKDMARVALSVIRQQSSVKVDDGALSGALRELVTLKNIKDTYGQTPDYLARQPRAWEAAKQALRSSEMPNGSGKED